MTSIGEASVRPGDVVETEEFGYLRVVLTDPKAFYGFKVADGSPTLRLQNYEDIDEYHARENVDDDEVREHLFDEESDRAPAHGDQSHDQTPKRAKVNAHADVVAEQLDMAEEDDDVQEENDGDE